MATTTMANQLTMRAACYLGFISVVRTTTDYRVHEGVVNLDTL